jgi:hypothetical protein
MSAIGQERTDFKSIGRLRKKLAEIYRERLFTMLRLVKSSPRRSAWIFFNLIGIGLYLLLASQLWPAPGEEDTPGGPGDAFLIFFALWPILLFFSAINVASLYRIIRHSNEKRIAILIWIMVALLWMAIIWVDHIQSSHIISAKYL